jgi:hypothetical protein
MTGARLSGSAEQLSRDFIQTFADRWGLLDAPPGLLG